MKKQILTFAVLAMTAVGGALTAHAITVTGTTSGRQYDCSRTQTLCSSIPENVILPDGSTAAPSAVFNQEKFNQ